MFFSMNRSDICTSLFLDSGNGWLESGEKGGSFLLFREPIISIQFRAGVTIVDTSKEQIRLRRDPLSVLEGYLKEGYTATGYIGYEYAAYTEVGFTPEHKKDGERLPDMYFLLFRDETKTQGSFDELKFNLSNHDYESRFNTSTELKETLLKSNMARDEYLSMVQRAKKYIEYGDLYQVNLSQRFTGELAISPLPYFLRMFHVQHVPFGSYMDFGDFQLLSGSMELFLRREGGKLSTKPIKGTKKRGISHEEDTIAKAELIRSEKERAENLMIVDLMRNDLSRICKQGTVKVKSLFNIESYTTLHQMVSEIEGELQDDISVGDIINNVFPPGSVTGAPKKRTLEVIDELEPHRRGPYCGAIGLFYPNGDFTLSVGIRLVLCDSISTTFWVGGGIVWDSDPLKEYEETLLKSAAIRRALGLRE